MGVNKLDIEFEDEEEIEARKEAERKKAEEVADIDLSFGAHEETEAVASPAASEGPSLDEIKKARKAAREKAKGEVQEAPASQQQAAPAQQPVQQAAPVQQQPIQQQVAGAQIQTIPQQQVFIGPDYKLGDELKKVAASNQILAIEIEARVKVEVTQQLTEITARHHADAKLLEHKINKLLTQMNQKAPALKNELMMIKKLLKEHASLGDEAEEDKPQQQAQRPNNAQASPQQRPVKKKAA